MKWTEKSELNLNIELGRVVLSTVSTGRGKHGITSNSMLQKAIQILFHPVFLFHRASHVNSPCDRCYFGHAKIADVHHCMQSVYYRVVFMKAHNLHFTWAYFLCLDLLIYIDKMMPGPILDIRGIGAFFGAYFLIKKAFCLLAPLRGYF